MFWETEMPLNGFKDVIVSYLVYKIYYFIFLEKGFHYVSLSGTMSTRLALAIYLPLSLKYWD